MEKLKKVLNNFKDKKILVVGDIILDKFIWGVVDRLNPEQPAAPLVKVKEESYELGGGANVANNVSSLGADCTLIGVIGRGQYGDKVNELCFKGKIKFQGFREDKPTLVKQRVMAHGQQLTRLDFGEYNLKKIDREIRKDILKSFEKELQEDYDFVILSDYDKGLFEEKFVQELILLSKAYKVPVHVDPKPGNIGYFKGCNVISPNKKEAQEITEIMYSNGRGILTKMCRSLENKVNSDYVIITCGKDGVFAYDSKKEDSYMVETKAREVSDVAGAGDTFVAALVLGLSSNLSLFDSVNLANYASGVVVGKPGVTTPSVEEIIKNIERDSKI